MFDQYEINMVKTDDTNEAKMDSNHVGNAWSVSFNSARLADYT